MGSRRSRQRPDKREIAAEVNRSPSPHLLPAYGELLDSVGYERTGLATVDYNHLTASFDTSDGTSVAVEVVYSADSASGVFRIAQIREQQRAAKRLADEAAQEIEERNESR